MKNPVTKQKREARIILAGIFIIILTLVVLAGNALAVTDWTPRQKQAHEIAELARAMGLPESDPIIQRASEIWWEDDIKAYLYIE